MLTNPYDSVLLNSFSAQCAFLRFANHCMLFLFTVHNLHRAQSFFTYLLTLIVDTLLLIAVILKVSSFSFSEVDALQIKSVIKSLLFSKSDM